jgi:F-type H+-transporting ATPase subunit b
MDLLAQIVTNVVGFLLLVFILRRFFWNAVLRVLDARRARIEDGLRSIEQSTRDLERLKQELRDRLAKIDGEARVKIQQAIVEGRRIAQEIQEEARAQALGLIAKSKETITLELAKAKVSLRDELADLAIDAIERLLKQKCDPETDRALVAAVLEELGRSPAS